MRYKWNIIGHEKELLTLEEKLRAGFSHAVLFVGPENIGKFAIAKTLANILQCPNDFCRECPTCVQISKGHHLDTIEMDDDGSSIKIEQMRDVIARLSMTAQSFYKILLLANIGRMTEEAGNSLLKILEEPTERTFFFFTASSLREVLPTILSRMQTIKLKLPPEETLKTLLGEKFPEMAEATLENVIMLSLGKPGRAISLIQNPDKFAFYRELFDTVNMFQNEKNIAQRFQFIRSIADDPNYIKEFLILLTAYLRQQLLLEKNVSKKTQIASRLYKLQNFFDLLKRNVNSRLLLENFSL